ncbi:probable pyridoxal 5'-phosphate synthase subunit PDX1 [Cynara cardunculus var. scolymus]|uniref:probable pyridoxal 5'-phosphate synthase subunit PDX1 n=1 Tax=Cynara cardunculus var. scolymus TaxID=59895 RepID=UPI000D624A8E|nr:probable pyridoxal 5'-phosphate synthase subunit PDX1 [Cynara cardunculus var. scolymus]
MAEDESGVLTVYGVAGPLAQIDKTIFSGKAGRAKMFRGGVIIDVVTPDQARIAEEAGACAVMVLENFAADIRTLRIVSRMSDPKIIKDIKEAVNIPVFAKIRIGHFVEAQILDQIGVHSIDESEVLTPADPEYHINKLIIETPFICGCKNLSEALSRIREGAVMIRTKGEAGNGNIMEAVRQIRSITGDIRRLSYMNDTELDAFSRSIFAPYELLKKIKELGRLPVVQFGAGGIATPADAAMMMQLGCDGIIVGSGIFKTQDPGKTAKAIVQAAKHYNDPAILAEVSYGLGSAMVGIILDNDVARFD